MQQLIARLNDLPVEADPEFVSRLRDQVVAIGSATVMPTSPLSRQDDEAPIRVVDLDNHSTATDDVSRTVSGRRSPLTTAAFAAVLIVIGFVAGAVLRPSDSARTTAGGDEQAAAVETATEFMAAYGDLDLSRTVSLLADDRQLSIGGLDIAVEQMELFFSYRSTVAEDLQTEGCEAPQPTDQDGATLVVCRGTFANRWSAAVGAEPVESTFFLRVEADGITIVRGAIDTPTFVLTAFEPYVQFLNEHGESGFYEAMFQEYDGPILPSGLGGVGPRLTEESIALHARYTAEFEAANR